MKVSELIAVLNTLDPDHEVKMARQQLNHTSTIKAIIQRDDQVVLSYSTPSNSYRNAPRKECVWKAPGLT